MGYLSDSDSSDTGSTSTAQPPAPAKLPWETSSPSKPSAPVSPKPWDKPTTTAPVSPKPWDKPATTTAPVSPKPWDKPATTTAPVSPKPWDTPATTAPVSPKPWDKPATTAPVSPKPWDNPAASAGISPKPWDKPSAAAAVKSEDSSEESSDNFSESKESSKSSKGGGGGGMPANLLQPALPETKDDGSASGSSDGGTSTRGSRSQSETSIEHSKSEADSRSRGRGSGSEGSRSESSNVIRSNESDRSEEPSGSIKEASLASRSSARSGTESRSSGSQSRADSRSASETPTNSVYSEGSGSSGSRSSTKSSKENDDPSQSVKDEQSEKASIRSQSRASGASKSRGSTASASRKSGGSSDNSGSGTRNSGSVSRSIDEASPRQASAKDKSSAMPSVHSGSRSQSESSASRSASQQHSSKEVSSKVSSTHESGRNSKGSIKGATADSNESSSQRPNANSGSGSHTSARENSGASSSASKTNDTTGSASEAKQVTPLGSDSSRSSGSSASTTSTEHQSNTKSSSTSRSEQIGERRSEQPKALLEASASSDSSSSKSNLRQSLLPPGFETERKAAIISSESSPPLPQTGDQSNSRISRPSPRSSSTPRQSFASQLRGFPKPEQQTGRSDEQLSSKNSSEPSRAPSLRKTADNTMWVPPKPEDFTKQMQVKEAEEEARAVPRSDPPDNTVMKRDSADTPDKPFDQAIDEGIIPASKLKVVPMRQPRSSRVISTTPPVAEISVLPPADDESTIGTDIFYAPYTSQKRPPKPPPIDEQTNDKVPNASATDMDLAVHAGEKKAAALNDDSYARESWAPPSVTKSSTEARKPEISKLSTSELRKVDNENAGAAYYMPQPPQSQQPKEEPLQQDTEYFPPWIQSGFSAPRAKEAEVREVEQRKDPPGVRTTFARAVAHYIFDPEESEMGSTVAPEFLDGAMPSKTYPIFNSRPQQKAPPLIEENESLGGWVPQFTSSSQPATDKQIVASSGASATSSIWVPPDMLHGKRKPTKSKPRASSRHSRSSISQRSPKKAAHVSMDDSFSSFNWVPMRGSARLDMTGSIRTSSQQRHQGENSASESTENEWKAPEIVIQRDRRSAPKVKKSAVDAQKEVDDMLAKLERGHAPKEAPAKEQVEVQVHKVRPVVTSAYGSSSSNSTHSSDLVINGGQDRGKTGSEPDKKNPTKMIGVLLCCFVIILLAVAIPLAVIPLREDKGATAGSNETTPTLPPSSDNGYSEEELEELIKSASPDNGAGLSNMSGPQRRAFNWLLTNRFLNTYGEDQILQRYSLATLYYTTNGSGWRNDNLWLSDADECIWYSSESENEVCNSNGNLDEVDLENNGVSGSLPWNELAIISPDLLVLDFFENDLTGRIPSSLLREFTSLYSLDLFRNEYTGSIPSEISMLDSLEYIDLSKNFFTGTLPATIAGLSEIKTLLLSDNFLSGSIPSGIRFLTNLENLYLVS